MRLPRLATALALLLAAPVAGRAAAQDRAPACAPCGRPAARHTVTVDGHPIAVWAKRPAAAHTAILLVHGRRWSARPNFDLQVPGERRSVMDALAARGYAVYAVDMRGNGATPRDASGFVTPDRAVADVAAVLDWITQRERGRATAGARRPVLLGYSRGATTAMLLAQRHPTALAALVLYAFPIDPDSLGAPPLDPATPARARNTAAAAAEDFITPGAASAAVRDAYVAAALAADPVTVDWAGARQLAALDASAVHVPTLVLDGARDPYAAGTAHARLFARLGTADRTWVVLPDADHAAHVETAHDAWIRAVTAFVERPRGAAASRR